MNPYSVGDKVIAIADVEYCHIKKGNVFVVTSCDMDGAHGDYRYSLEDLYGKSYGGNFGLLMSVFSKYQEVSQAEIDSAASFPSYDALKDFLDG